MYKFCYYKFCDDNFVTKPTVQSVHALFVQLTSKNNIHLNFVPGYICKGLI